MKKAVNGTNNKKILLCFSQNLVTLFVTGCVLSRYEI